MANHTIVIDIDDHDLQRVNRRPRWGCRMPAVTLQVQLPAEPKLTPEQIAAITGRQQLAKQVAWLQDQLGL